MKKTYIVIGTSAAGLNALSTLHQLAPESTIIGVTQESGPVYNKCLLIDHLIGHKNERDITLKIPFSSSPNLLFNKKVTSIVPEAQKIIVNDAEEIFYDALLLTTGTQPYIPPLIQPFMQLHGLVSFHTLSDTKVLITQIHHKKVCVIVGAGINGLECASALVKKGHVVIVIEKGTRILPSLHDEKASKIIEAHLRKQGIIFFKEMTITQLIHKNNHLEGITLSSGVFITTTLLILTTGTFSTADYAPFLLQEQGKIVVNNTFQTSFPSIYAAGDCIQFKDTLPSSASHHQWSSAVLQGISAAWSMRDKARLYRPLPPVVQITLGGLPLCFGGAIAEEYDSTAFHSVSHDYEKIIVNKKGNLQGFVLIGKIEKAFILRKKLHESIVL